MFHGLEGGAIAEQRPPPPGADAPYPNLASIPARPPAPDVARQQRIADRLAGQRDAATTDAAINPLTVRPTPPAVPKPAAAPDPNANRVVVDAAAAPPPPTAPARPASAIDAVPAVPEAVASGPLPSLAPSPPAPPVGLAVPTPLASVSARVALPPTVAPAAAADTVSVAFTPGSATLPPSAPLNLRRFAQAHKGVAVTILGRGDAVLPGADSQARGLDLGLRRAQAIAASLATAGVAASNLHLRAQATGQGGTASL